jgi:glycoside/pentoside/hexuronide:cation symporter, GPH family
MSNKTDTSAEIPVHPPVPDTIIGTREKFGYAAGDFASCLFFKVFSSYLMFFYTDIIGISAAVIGTMMMVTRVFDAVNDPVMGMICDRTRSPHGKFRPWLRWMILPYAIAGVAIFLVPDWISKWQIVYVYVTYTLAMIFYTAINIPYGALMGVMTPHSNERTVLASFRFYGAYAANLFVQATILILVIRLGGGDGQTATQTGYVMTMTLYAVGAAIFFLTTFYTTKERVRPPRDQETSLKKDLVQLVKNRPWLAIIVVGVTTIIWIAMRDAAVLYYFRYYVVEAIEEGERFAVLATWFSVVGTFSTMAGIAFTKWFTTLFGGKRNAYMYLTVIVAVAAILYYFARPGDVAYLFFVQIVTSFLMGPLMPLFWSMIADTADYSEWKFGRRFTGLTFSAGTFSQKIGWAIGPGIAGHLLGYYGFAANVAQSPETIQGLRMMMSFIPSAIGLGAAALVLLYGIDLKMERKIESQLVARKATGTAGVPPA